MSTGRGWPDSLGIRPPNLHMGTSARFRGNRSAAGVVQADEGPVRRRQELVVTFRARLALVALSIVFTALLEAPGAAAQTGAPPWAACGASSPEDKPVTTFPARPPVGGPARTYAVLLCGNPGFGYRHIADGHGRDWEDLAVYTGGNWRALADFAIRQTLTVPQPGNPAFDPKNETWTYKAPLEIRDAQGNVRATYWPIVSVAARDGRIVTSFPTRDQK